MGKSLVIVESNAKAKTINKILGSDYTVAASYGHVRDLPEKGLGVDIENNFAPEYEVSADKKLIAQLRKLASQAENVYLATDPDREGEAISWHLAELLKSKNGSLHRIMFNEITKEAVRKAIAKPGKINFDLVNAQQARRILDRLVGYKISPLLRRIGSGLSAGRVQSVALRLICEREEEILAFTPLEYWTIESTLVTGGGETLRARLFRIGDKRVMTGDKEGEEGYVRIKSEAHAREICAAMRSLSYAVASVEQKPRTRNPPPPFITSTLQQDASRKLGYPGSKTMAIAQQLYEGIDLGEETTGLITYMRTDSVRIADEALAHARDMIGRAYGPRYLPEEPRRFKVKSSAQDAHEAIRPTQVELTPKELKNRLTKEQLAVYDLIWRRFVASQMMPARFLSTTIDIQGGEYNLRASGSVLEFDGFLKVYDVAEEDEELRLAKVAVGESLTVADLHPEEHVTRPPARYNDASLIKALEEKGIGRPSTYASIIQVLLDRRYVNRVNKSFRPTDLGVVTCAALVRSFPKEIEEGFTAHMEELLDEIEQGKAEWHQVLREFYFGGFDRRLDAAKETIHQAVIGTEVVTEELCPVHAEPMVMKWGRFGFFLTCPLYPDCKETKNIGRPESVEPELLRTPCPRCGHRLVKRWQRYRHVHDCPQCGFQEAQPMLERARPVRQETSDIACPRNGCDGRIVARTSRRGKVFYGCNQYPKCDFVAWAPVVNRPCPECSEPWMVFKDYKRTGPTLKCEKCKHTMPAPQDIMVMYRQSGGADES